VLEAVAGAAADEPPARALRMLRDEELRVARERVLANACARRPERCSNKRPVVRFALTQK
jgi:hypothetical protein